MQQEEIITNKPYYFANFRNTTEVAEFLKLKSKGMAGVFLVRPSFKNPQNLTVSVVVKDRTIRHTNIIIDNTGSRRTYYLVKEKQFCTLQDLLDYYKTNDVKNLEQVNHVRFVSPVLRTNRGSIHDDNSSNSSSTFQSPFTVAPSPPDRPPLPERPTTLQRRHGSNSSQTSLLNAASSMQAISPMGYHAGFTPDSNSPKGFPQGYFPDTFSPSSPGAADDRPPAPLPGGHKTGGLYYSTPRNVEEDISEKLKEVLKQNDRCDCGIPRDMADMPLGWTVHKSKDPGTYGRLFFQNVQGVTTWKIPAEVQENMTVQQNFNIRNLTEMFSNQRSRPQSGFQSYLESPSNSTGSDMSDLRPDLSRRSNMVVFNGQNPNINSTKF